MEKNNTTHWTNRNREASILLSTAHLSMIVLFFTFKYIVLPSSNSTPQKSIWPPLPLSYTPHYAAIKFIYYYVSTLTTDHIITTLLLIKFIVIYNKHIKFIPKSRSHIIIMISFYVSLETIIFANRH